MVQFGIRRHQNGKKRITLLYFQDPWIRNEVWRFDRRQFGMADRPVLIRRLLSRGIKPGFALAVVTAGEDIIES